MPPPLPVADAPADPFDDLPSVDGDPVDIHAMQRGRWVVVSGGAQAETVEADLVAQVARASAQLQIALGRLAGIHAAVDGIEAALAVLATAGDCPACSSGEIRAALARVRALAESR